MKIALYTDVHLHNHSGSYDKAKDIERSLYEMLDICKVNGVDAYFNLGDTFETQEAVKTRHQNIFYNFCLKMDRPHYILIGNHDMPNKTDQTINALEPYRHIENTHVISKNSKIEVGSDNFIFIPYTEKIDDRFVIDSIDEEKNNILFAHLAISGTRMNSHKRCNTGVEIDYSKFKMCFFGHFHLRQKLSENAYYIGSLTQQTWSGAGNESGFAIYDTDTDKLEFFDLKSIKHNHIEDVENALDEDIKGNCIKLHLKEEFSSARKEQIIDEFKERGALDVQISFSDVSIDNEKMIDLEHNVSTTDVYMEKVIEDSKTELDKEALMEIGKECLASANDIL